MTRIAVLIFLSCLTLIPANAKEAGVFFPPQLIEKARANTAKYPWAIEQKKLIVEAAKPWMNMSDDELWSLMFGPTIHRSWHVLSDGVCPSCKGSVMMYSWKINYLAHPWKVQCPHCSELFPKNDFYKFYRSGLDEHGVFDPRLADRSLLFNTEHPDPNDPLHMFGVDDGMGYVEGGKKWQFISTYLIYGQWKQAVLGGIRNLATAYAITGDPKYARKSGILLDRVADLYPTFDYMTQADLYDDRNHGNGYVSVWHDACEETRELAMDYDMIFDVIRKDKSLSEFLSNKAREHKLDNPKASPADIQRNIEDRILKDALNNIPKITSNYPRTPVCTIVIKTVLDWPKNRDEVNAIFDDMLAKATAVDGVTGEKGLAGYSAFTIQGVANLLEQFARLDPNFLDDMLKRCPRIHDMYRFHIDAWCLQEYYPEIGDSGFFGQKADRYVGVYFTKGHNQSPIMYEFTLTPSMFSFLWRMYELTDDKAFVQVLYNANGDSTENLPYDLFADDPKAFQQNVQSIIAREGTEIKLGSVNKEQWRLGILRSGQGADARALWMEYDAWGGHGHANCMELGLFAKGLDLMPDFGYKPVNYGGWDAPKAVWYGKTAAHNTVVVDGQDQGNGAGTTTLWADGQEFRAIRVSGPACMGGTRFERTAALIDISDKDSYVLDVFRVGGGSDHAKFTHSHYGSITSQGLNLSQAPDYGYGTQMRNFVCDSSPQPGWSVDWDIEDRYKYLPEGSDVHLRYTDLTVGAQAYTAESWIQAMNFNSNEEAWIPTVMVRRQSKDAPLASTFVSIIEPYEKRSNITQIKRLPLETSDGTVCPDLYAAVEIRLEGARRDLLVSADAPSTLVQKDWDLRTDAELCLVRRNAYGKVSRIVICKGSFLEIGDTDIKLKGKTDFVEAVVKDGKATIISGNDENMADG